MAQQEDPVQQEIDRLAQGNDTELPVGEGSGEMIEGGQEDVETGPAEASRSETASSEEPSETSRRGMPGYQ